MDDLDDFEQKRSDFEVWRRANKRHFVQLENLRKQFLRQFPQDKLSDLQIDQYVEGKSKDSFCNWLENRLVELGSMGGSNAFKFGIYYGRTKKDPVVTYRSAKKFGANKEAVFNRVKQELVALLSAGRTKDIDAIHKNKLSPMFKGKILSVYYPDDYLNIFAREHLEFYLLKLSLSFASNEIDIVLRQELIDFKYHDPLMRQWSNLEFSNFLWTSFREPTKPGKLPPEFETDDIELPPPEQVEPHIITPTFLEVAPQEKNRASGTRAYKPDYMKAAKRNTTVGRQGEEVILRREKQELSRAGRNDLAKKVEWVSQQSDTFGYDIHSFTKDGTDKLIEVKTTRKPFTHNPSFIMSVKEYEVGKEQKDRYYICLVFMTKRNKYDIVYIQNPFGLAQKKFSITPTSYAVDYRFDPREIS
jgi:Domain of unknown function (DUF3883)